MNKWKIENRTEVLKKKIFSIYDNECVHPNGTRHTFSIIDAPDWINIFAVTENGRYLFVKQHRLGTDEITIETTAGIIEKNEDPLAAAKRELLEETGFVPRRMFLLRKLKSNPAIMNNYIYFFFADGCTRAFGQNLDTTEDIELAEYSPGEFTALIEAGHVDHQIVITAYLLAQESGNI